MAIPRSDYGERITSLEEGRKQSDKNDEEFKVTIKQIADDVSQIKLLLAKKSGIDSAIDYLVHAGVGVAGIIVGWYGKNHS